MGFYSRFVFPRLCDALLGLPGLAEHRRRALLGVRGEILEVGFGTGLNLPHYPEGVRRITAVDPSPGMGRRALRRIAASGIAVDHRRMGGEDLPFPAATFDSVVTTWTLCSIPEVEKALAEIYRVLRPGGRFFFLEHGRSDDPSVRRWQRRINPIEGALGDGCRLDVDIEGVVRGQPFARVEVDRFQLRPLPRTHGTMYRGVATR